MQIDSIFAKEIRLRFNQKQIIERDGKIPYKLKLNDWCHLSIIASKLVLKREGRMTSIP